MDVHALWRLSVAGLRYQYVRDLGSARFAAVEHQLLDTGPEARELWDGYTSAFPRRRYTVRLRHPARGVVEFGFLMGQLSPPHVVVLAARLVLRCLPGDFQELARLLRVGIAGAEDPLSIGKQVAKYLARSSGSAGFQVHEAEVVAGGEDFRVAGVIVVSRAQVLQQERAREVVLGGAYTVEAGQVVPGPPCLGMAGSQEPFAVLDQSASEADPRGGDTCRIGTEVGLGHDRRRLAELPGSKPQDHLGKIIVLAAG